MGKEDIPDLTFAKKGVYLAYRAGQRVGRRFFENGGSRT
jgi:hypothetical protein